MRTTLPILLATALFAAWVPQDPQPKPKAAPTPEAKAASQDPVSPAARASSLKALRWLLKAQNHDGSWGDNPNTPGEVGNTSIAILALLSTGSTPARGQFARAIERGMQWLRVRTRNNNADLDTATLLQSKLGQNIDLYLVTLVYSQVLGSSVDRRDDAALRDYMTAAAKRIAGFQKPNGAWETSYEPMLTTISAWLALRMTHDAGVTVPQASPLKVVEYLEKVCLDRGTGIFREAKWGNQMRFVTQAGATRVLCGMGRGETPDGKLAKAALLKMRFDQDVSGHQGGEEFLGAVFATQAMHIEGGTDFETWYPKIVTSLRSCQNKDGSWLGHHCITGRVFCTACSIITMLTPQKMLPMIER